MNLSINNILMVIKVVSKINLSSLIISVYVIFKLEYLMFVTYLFKLYINKQELSFIFLRF